MGRVYLCLGKNAEVPWYFDRARARVWNIEELCYFIRENAWLIDSTVTGKKLAAWVGEQCKLPELSQLLLAAGREKNPVGAFVRALFLYTGYCSEQEAQQVEKILNINDSAGDLERAKARGDYFLESRRYVLALKEYDEMISGLTGMKPDFLAKIYHNRGVALAGLFWFEKAAKSFDNAWKLAHIPESARQFLAAERFLMTEQEYVSFLAQNPELYEQSLALEQQVKKCEASFTDSEEHRFISHLMDAKADGAAAICGQMAAERLERLKEDYRDYVIQ